MGNNSPPEFDFDAWLDVVVEPNADDLDSSENNAKLLLADLGV